MPHRGELLLAGSVICYRPYECADGWVSLGALEPKFWQAWCRGVEREDLIEHQFERPGSDAHAQVVEIFKARSRASGSSSRASTTAAWSRCWSSTRRSTPSWCAPARWSSSSTSLAPRSRCASSAIPVKLERTPGEHDRLPGPALGEHTEEVLAAVGYSAEEIAALLASGAAAGHSATAPGRAPRSGRRTPG